MLARRTWRRRAGWALLGLAFMALLSVLSVGWYYADEILRPPQAEKPVYDVTVADVGEATVTVGAEAVPDGVWGLQWPEGYARVGEVVDADPDAGTATRRMVPVIGALHAGQEVAVDAHAYPADAADAFVFPTETVLLEGPDGPLPADVVVPDVAAPDDERTAWRAGPRDTWVIMVHGRGGSRSEAFRALPTIRALGLPALILGYRNDPDAPASPDGHSGLGSTEWRDVQAATDYAIAHGARDVVLVGYSMGGTIVSTYLHEAPDADRVVGLVLDAPVLDWDVVLRAAAVDRGVPLWLTPVARGIITVRTGLRWGRLDQVARAEDFDVPILLFHGTQDPTVPVASSDAFAAARPDLVTYVRVEGAGHVRAWNADPDAYEAHLRDFLLTTVGR